VDVRALRRAVLRRLVAVRTWAAWSPRRARTIAGVALTLLVAAPLTAGLLRGALDGGSAAAAAVAAGRGTPPSVPAQDPDAAAPLVTASPSGPNDEAIPITPAQEEAAAGAAKQFASLWLAGAYVPDRQRWAATMKDLVVPSLVPYLESTPDSAVPRTTVTTVVPKLVAPTYGAARVTFADGTGMDVGLSDSGSGWRVTQYLPTTRS
jgi:hypothetical protein